MRCLSVCLVGSQTRLFAGDVVVGIIMQILSAFSRFLSRVLTCQLIAVLALSSLFNEAAFAGQIELTKGLTWLQGQVTASGQLVNQSKLATLTQAQCESANTIFGMVGGSSPSVRLANCIES